MQVQRGVDITGLVSGLITEDHLGCLDVKFLLRLLELELARSGSELAGCQVRHNIVNLQLHAQVIAGIRTLKITAEGKALEAQGLLLDALTTLSGRNFLDGVFLVFNHGLSLVNHDCLGLKHKMANSSECAQRRLVGTDLDEGLESFISRLLTRLTWGKGQLSQGRDVLCNQSVDGSLRQTDPLGTLAQHCL